MFNVGQEVGVIRYGTWGGIIEQGIYTVSKSNQVRVHLKRKSDGYERIFSAKTGIEKGSNVYRSAEIVSLNEYDKIVKSRLRREEFDAGWTAIKYCVEKKDLLGLQAAVKTLADLQATI